MNSLNLKSEQVKGLCRKYHVQSLSLFGSMARGEETLDSDLDLLVSFSQPVTLLQMVAFERELSSTLRVKVDLVTEASLSPYLRKQILKERQLVYAA
jgi:predicted nucleotidyltransferase